AELPRGDLYVLALDRVLHVDHGQAEGFELLRIEPDAHAVRPGAEDLHLTDAWQTRQGILYVDDRVVAEKGLVDAVVVGVEGLDQQEVGADLAAVHALRLPRAG